MTSTRERREEYSSNVVRVLSPSRPLTPTNLKSDSNLEYLLEDLQSSISRPGSSLGHNPPGSYSTTTREVQYLNPSNNTTVVRERSRSPLIVDGGTGKKMYKKSHYEYSTTSGSAPTNDMSYNTNQLDSLLSDLKHERDASFDLVDNSRGLSGKDSGLRVTKTEHHTYSSAPKNNGVQRELVFDSPDAGLTRNSRSRQRTPEPGYVKTIERTYTTSRDGGNYGVDDGLYGGINRATSPPSRTLSPTLKSEKYYTETNNTYNTYNSNDGDVVPPHVPYNETVRVETTRGAGPLQHIPVSDDILPKPATKVTTTVRTYTYEIPGDELEGKNVVYKNESYNTLNSTSSRGYNPEHDIIQSVPPTNKTVVYRNETHNTTNTVDYPLPNQNLPSHPGYNKTVTYKTDIINDVPPQDPGFKTTLYKKDTRETTTNSYPGGQYPPPQHQYPQNGHPIHPTNPPPTNQTVIYKHDVTNTTNTVHPPPVGGVAVYPINGTPLYPANGPNQGPPPGPKTTYYYKHEKTNTTNTKYGPPGSNYPNEQYPQYPPDNTPPFPAVEYPNTGSPNGHQPGYPPNTTTVYNYSTNTTTRNVHGHPDDRSPLLHPTPFPTQGFDVSDGNGNPPKRLDDLMATFGDNSPNSYPYQVTEPIQPRKRETDLSLASSPTSKPIAAIEPKSAKNISGPPVYYPPNHELFASKEEGGGAWRAEGGNAKGSGKYEYEASSKSKSKSSSGAAVVPLCLPMCCALPCVIM